MNTQDLVDPDESCDAMAERALIAQTELAVSSTYPNARSNRAVPLTYVRNPANENRVLLDQKGRPITVDRMLATKPFRQDLSTRPGPGGRRLTYITGDGVSRSLNEIFGYEGWSLDIKSVTQTGKEKDKRGRWNVAYLAHVRITLTASGAFKEDMGSGDSMDSNLQTAVSHAMKASITDALKRAARHFGDKLGNSLYGADFAINKAPTTLFQALDEYERNAREKWGASNVPSSTNRSTETNRQSAPVSTTAAATRTAVATNMPPPPPSVNGSCLPPSVTPNVNNKPNNVYQRNSLGTQPQQFSTTTSSRATSVYATPRVSTGSISPMNTNHHTTFVPPPPAAAPTAQPLPIRQVLAENSAAANPGAPLTAAQALQARFQGGDSSTPVQPTPPQQLLARPQSSYKRPGPELVAPNNTTADPTAKRTRHNPYA